MYINKTIIIIDINISNTDISPIIYNVGVKGEGWKRVKTFKIDRSTIPMDYQCKMYKDDKEVLVPFIFFVLNNYFEHKELLEEYFHDILRI